MELNADMPQGAQITTNNLCGMPVVWGAELSQNSSLTPEKIKETFALSVPLTEDITKNGQCAKGLFIVNIV